MRRRQFLTGASLVAGAAMSGAASADENAGAVPERFVAALNARDMAAFANLFAEDYVNHQVSAAAPPPSGKSAKNATVAFFQARVDALPDLRVSIEASLASGDKVAASFVNEGTHDGAIYFGVATTGRKLRFSSCDIFRVVGGKIVEHWGMGDIAGVLKQLKG